MAEPPRENFTRLIEELASGNKEALNELLPIVYGDLRDLAMGYMRRERREHTLQPTALVHEAYLRLVDQRTARWESRAHFLKVAATAMRHILVDHARSRGAQKRGGGGLRVPLSGALAAAPEDDVDLVALDEALKTLETFDPRKAQVVELRFFAGLTTDDAAKALGTSPRTVDRDWKLARTWLYREMRKGEDAGGEAPAGD